jgi:RHS repeat-associated protein
VAHEFEATRLVATTYFDKFRVSYRTEENGGLVITDPTGAKHRVRVGDGGVIAKHLANGARELCLYDAVGRCRRKAVVWDDRYRPPWMRSFSYSRAGDFLGVTDTVHGTVRYRYDQAHRIAEETVTEGSRRAFEYDPAGNLRFQPGLTDVEMDSGNRLRAANGDRFTYNDRDQLSAREGPAGTTRYEYNALDMLVRCEINGESWTASYDALCRRIRKNWRGRTTTYYWDDFRLAAEVRHDGSLRLYLYEDDVGLVPFMFIEYADLDSEPASGKRYYIFSNQIGVPIRVDDDEGRTCWSARIDPYGRAHVGRDGTLEMPLRFPGHYHDPETGLHYNRFRYFSPELGRYLQPDPVGLKGGINLYAYPVDPLTSADIDGLRRAGSGGSRPQGPKGQGGPGGTSAGCSRSPRQRGGATSSNRALARPVNFAGSPRQSGFATQDAAARAALRDANPQSIRHNVEYGGLIYHQNGRYHYTPPVRGHATGFNTRQAQHLVPSNAEEVGDYHTHGDYSREDPVTLRVMRTTRRRDEYRSDQFSRGDLAGIRAAGNTAAAAGRPGYAGYLGTPSGHFRRYDPATNSDTALSRWSWFGR